MNFVTLDQARSHLRVDSDNCDDPAIELDIEAASIRVLEYIDNGILNFKDSNGDFLPEFSDSAGNWIPPSTVRQATLLLVGYYYNQRDQDKDKEFDGGELPRPVRSLLRNLRRPVI